MENFSLWVEVNKKEIKVYTIFEKFKAKLYKSKCYTTVNWSLSTMYIRMRKGLKSVTEIPPKELEKKNKQKKENNNKQVRINQWK